MDVIAEWIKSNAVISTVILIILISYIIHWILFRARNLPPGPVGLPILGYLPFVRNNTPVKFDQLGKKYGGVFSLYLGSRFTVVLTDYQSIKEGLNTPAILARPPDMPFDVLNDTEFSKTSVGGKEWMEQRRFIVHLLKDLGLGKNKLEEHIKEEISYFVEEIRKLKGAPCFHGELISSSASNNICYLILGRRFAYNSPERKFLDDNLNELIKFFGQTVLHVSFPPLKRLLLALGLFEFGNAKTAALNLKEYIKKEVEEHKNTLDRNNIRDYIDGYLVQLEERPEEENRLTYHTMSMLFQTVQGLFGAGSGTIKDSMMWAALILAQYQTVQDRIQREIDDVIGRHREPSWADHAKMPYTQAAILEMQRWKIITPVNIARYCREDVMLKGYNIPNGSLVLANFWSLHYNVDYWKDPEVFRPERFLNKTETETIRHDYYMPFSVGKMSCPGESLAKTELFLYISSILQRFNIKAPEGKSVDLEGILGVCNISKPQQLCFIERD